MSKRRRRIHADAALRDDASAPGHDQEQRELPDPNAEPFVDLTRDQRRAVIRILLNVESLFDALAKAGAPPRDHRIIRARDSVRESRVRLQEAVRP